jgi:hypothetical protein
MKRKLTEYQAEKLSVQKLLDALSCLWFGSVLSSEETNRALKEIRTEALVQGVDVRGTRFPWKWKAVRKS